MSMFKTTVAAAIASTIAALAVSTAVTAAGGDSGLTFHPITPTRVADTRDGPDKVTTVARQFLLSAVVPPQAEAVVLNVTAVNPVGDGYLRVYPCNSAAGTSSVNYRAGQVVANSVTVAVESQRVCVSSYAASDVIIDVFGWYGPATGGTASLPVGTPLVGDGTWLIGTQIAAGRYLTNAPAGCYWERLSNLSGQSSAIIANDFVPNAGQVIVDIAPTDVAFHTDGCGTWSVVS